MEQHRADLPAPRVTTAMRRGKTRRPPRGTRGGLGTRATIYDTGARARGTRGHGRSRATPDGMKASRRRRGGRRATGNEIEESDSNTTGTARGFSFLLGTNVNQAQYPAMEVVEMTQNAPSNNMSQ